MISYIEGLLVEKTPTYAVIDCQGIGYYIHISLQTYSKIANLNRCKLFTHQVIREDAHLLFGFASPEERTLFRLLITVQGVGANSARMILSSLSAKEIFQAILNNQAPLLQSVKGIGLKTAQKIILELKDKVSKDEYQGEIFATNHNTIEKEALSALITLGFPKVQVEKAISMVLKQYGDSLTIEEFIKYSLKIL